MLVCGAVVSTVQVQAAGIGSQLPAASTARTSIVYWPSARPAIDRAAAQGAKATGRMRHSNVAPASPEANANDAERDATSACGPVIDVSGASVSTVNVAAAGAPVLPAASVASATAVCGPSPSAAADTAQRPCASAVAAPSAVPSMATETRAPGSAVPESCGALDPTNEPGAGDVNTGDAGAVRSTTQVAEAGVASALPARSRARTAS